MKNTMSFKELQVVLAYINHRQANALRSPLYSAVDTNSVVISRRSDRECDLTVEGKTVDGIGFSAWLVLGMISNLPWTTKKIAEMTDYPMMAMEGDWSGVRDTDDEKLWTIFNTFCNPQETL